MTTRKERRAPVPRFAVDMSDAGDALGVSTPGAYSLVEQGLLRSFVIGRRRLVSLEALAECVRQLEAQGAPLPSASDANNRKAAFDGDDTPRPPSTEAAREEARREDIRQGKRKATDAGASSESSGARKKRN